MHIREQKLPRARQLAGAGQELSREALVRLAWIDFYRRRGRNVALTCRRAKLNGVVERAQRTHTEEFYQVTTCSLEMAALNRELREWKKTYNMVRPHQALGYLTPHQFLQQWHSQQQG